MDKSSPAMVLLEQKVLFAAAEQVHSSREETGVVSSPDV
jgi:hypothetical protein